jgi:RNA polymerase sigma-70 factor, ECF subfamily
MEAIMTVTDLKKMAAVPMDQDRALLEEFLRSGDRAALMSLFQRHAEACWRLALRLSGNPADAEDAVQDGFVRVIAAARQYRGSGSVRSWMLAVVANEHHRRVRSEKRRQRRELRSQNEPPSKSEGIDDRSRTALWDSLNELPDHYRLPLSMRHLDGLEYVDIAAALGRKEATIRSQVDRGLDLLRGLLGKRGVAVSSLVALSELATAHVEIPTGLMLRIKAVANGAVVPTAAASMSLVTVAATLAGAAIVTIGLVWSGVFSRMSLSGGDVEPPQAVAADGKPKKAPAMPAWRKGMKANVFSPIPGSSPNRVDLDPGYWEGRVFDIWNGWQADEKHGVIYSALGGGHSNLEQNGVYKQNLMVDKPVWEVVRKSTRYVTNENGGNLYFPDGRPVARHTYYDGHYVEIGGKGMLVFAEETAATPHSGAYHNVDAFHLDSGDWDLKGTGWQIYPGNPAYANCVAKDPRTQQIWVADNRAGIHHLDPAKKTWTTICKSDGFGFNGWGVGYCGSVIDVKRDRFIVAGSNSSPVKPAFGAWNISTNKYQDHVLIWPNGAIPQGEDFYAMSGLVHDTINDRYLWLSSTTGKLRAVDPEKFTVTDLTQTASAENGVQNRFTFIEALRGCVYLPRSASEMLFLPVK